MSRPAEANLSDARGNRLGFAFFRLFMRVFGVSHACRFTAVPAFFYALFDREAFACARGYLASRFPRDTALALRWRFFRQIMSVGSSMVLQHAVRMGYEIGHRETVDPSAREALEDSRRGVILLMSHIGCWQAALPFVGFAGRRVNLLIQANANRNVSAMFADAPVSIIDNSLPFGGLLECKAALERGEIVSIMGDREAGKGEGCIEMEMLGRTMNIPTSPWLLAARTGAALVPVVPVIDGSRRSMDISFCAPIDVRHGGATRPKASDFAPAVRAYAGILERVAMERPYQIYHYTRIGAEKGKEKENGSGNPQIP